jgi:hypothetical protein
VEEVVVDDVEVDVVLDVVVVVMQNCGHLTGQPDLNASLASLQTALLQ